MSPGTHHRQTPQSMQRIFLSTTPQPRNCVVLIRHLTSCRSVCIVDKNVKYQRTHSIQIDGGQPISVDLLFRSMTELHITNTSYRSVQNVEMIGQKKCIVVRFVRYRTCIRQMQDTIKTVCRDSSQTG